jgi:acyl-CoA thioester hydrolase
VLAFPITYGIVHGAAISRCEAGGVLEAIPTPFVRVGRVEPEWIDANGHMNIAAYVTAFDLSSDMILESLDLSWEYTRTSGYSVFVIGMNVDYQQELFNKYPIRTTAQLLDWDHKRIHFFHSMYHGSEGYLAATSEVLFVNVCMKQRCSAPFSEEIQTRIAHVAAAHAELGVPEGAFRKLGIRGK